MKELKIKDKQSYLNDNYPFTDVPDLADIKNCLHCNSDIVVGNYKVFANELGEEYIYYPNAPKCNGTIIDWMDIIE